LVAKCWRVRGGRVKGDGGGATMSMGSFSRRIGHMAMAHQVGSPSVSAAMCRNWVLIAGGRCDEMLSTFEIAGGGRGRYSPLFVAPLPRSCPSENCVGKNSNVMVRVQEAPDVSHLIRHTVTLGPRKLHQRSVAAIGFLRPQNPKILVANRIFEAQLGDFFPYPCRGIGFFGVIWWKILGRNFHF
jgi:hypothetical protein